MDAPRAFSPASGPASAAPVSRAPGFLAAAALAAADGFGPGVVARTVLVVEDDELVRETVVGELLDQGYLVIEAGTAEEGFEVLEKRPVGVLFTDIRLPGRMDGWDLAEAARAVNPHLPVIYATGYSPEAPRFVEKSIFLRKPYLPSAVVAAIERLVGPVPK
jgi:CheY-like chemotaxis protein